MINVFNSKTTDGSKIILYADDIASIEVITTDSHVSNNATINQWLKSYDLESNPDKRKQMFFFSKNNVNLGLNCIANIEIVKVHKYLGFLWLIVLILMNMLVTCYRRLQKLCLYYDIYVL